jgi:general secretion pathway protein A
MESTKRLLAGRIGEAIALTDAPRPGQFYCCSQRRHALREFWFGMSNGEIGVLTAPGGVGKTLLCRELLQRLPISVRSIYLPVPQGNDADLLKIVYCSMEMARRRDQKHTAASGAKRDPAQVRVVILDEAHRLGIATLQSLAEWRRRETARGYPVSLMLVGRPTLDATLSDPELSLFDTQITVRCSLDVFPQSATESYISHWIKTHPVPRVKFSEAANRIVHFATGGIPGLIDKVCTRALESVRLHGKDSVTALMAARAAWTVTGG